MTIERPRLPIYNLLLSISNLIDMVSPLIDNHHKQTAYIAYSLGKELGLVDRELTQLFLAGALHDIGAFSLKSKLAVLDFEFENPHQHAENGYLLLKDFKPLRKAARIIRYHHVHWLHSSGMEFNGELVPESSHILHLADRISILINQNAEIFGQIKGIEERILEQSGRMFCPKFVDVFRSIAGREYFWIDATSHWLNTIMRRCIKSEKIKYGYGSMLEVADVFSKIIDFRSQYTTSHSSGVAAVSEALGRMYGYDRARCDMIKVAGLLHDIGKLAVPSELLIKSSPLSQVDINILRKHPYYSYRAFDHMQSINEIVEWISFHHERLDGKGYPFHLKADQLSMESRIIAVADHFSALMEDRPYRKGMPNQAASGVLRKMSEESALDPDIVSLVLNNFDEVDSIRADAQAVSEVEYRRFIDLTERKRLAS
ncbi:MAG: HD domain-containing protein [Candidatus Hatepunaea meridiana]|nr:HD domain-containing protein [Candidatus Hatepunaea meridiana]